jgi:beta-mannosidase
MTTIDLNGAWTLQSPQHPQISIPMNIPGDNYSALLQSKLIENPYIATNEKEVQWVREADWIIEKEFTVSDKDMSARAIEMSLGRVDTLAVFSINGKDVLNCSNMFRHYKVDIKPFIRLGTNTISVKFSRVDLEGIERAKRLPFVAPSPRRNLIPHMNLLRKPQCHSGWDWGICLLVSGIYDAIKVSVIENVALNRATTNQVWNEDGSVYVDVTVIYETGFDAKLNVTFGEQIQTVACNPDGETVVRFHITEPLLWWPAGYGEQPLHTLTVELDSQIIVKQIGLRHLVLNTSEDEIGSAMEFQVNGFPITAKGANWIPIDALPGNESEERYRGLLQSAVDVNMNMIRVWGGGQYESDLFYELCDEYGLLVWQDMMFACAIYPSTDEFIEDVVPELRDQIRRLRDHCCIALWCGDNEVIGAIGWFPESIADKTKYTVNYDRLSRVLSQTISEEDPSRRFWASSPCNGDLDYGDAWHEDSKGDMHFWDVWHSGSSFNAYLDIQPRFCSEFGYQSWPSFAEIKTFAPKSDWNVTSPTFEGHQKNLRGNSIITEMFTRYFRFPANFEQMLYMSQVQQAIAIKTGCEYWRTQSPICRGMLYWQLNDNWPVSSWSSIEYSGRWKQLHYHAKRFFSPVYIPFLETSEDLSLILSNNTRMEETVKGKVLWISWEGEELGRWKWNHVIQPDGNECVWQLNKKEWAEKRELGFFYAEIECNGELVQNTWFPIPELKKVPIEKTDISVIQNGSELILSTDKPALFVHLEHDGNGRFSDSSFTLLPKCPKTIRYLGDDLDSLANSLRVYDLSNSY